MKNMGVASKGEKMPGNVGGVTSGIKYHNTTGACREKVGISMGRQEEVAIKGNGHKNSIQNMLQPIQGSRQWHLNSIRGMWQNVG